MLSDQQVSFGSIQLGDSARTKIFKIISQSIKQRSFSTGFLGCVDYIGSNLPTYTEIVKNPISLEIIKKNILTLKYRFMYNFLADVVQIHSNCTKFATSSGTQEIVEQVEELTNYIFTNLRLQFSNNLTKNQFYQLGQKTDFKPICFVMNFDVDITMLSNQINSLTDSQKANMKNSFNQNLSSLSGDQIYALQKEVCGLIYI